MQNLNIRSSSTYHTWKTPPGSSYDTFKPSSSRVYLRNSTGYTGPRPKPSPHGINHAYSLNIQEHIKLTNDSSYYYTDGSQEHGFGDFFAPSISLGAVILPSYDWSSLENRALEKLNENVRGSLDLSIDLAEAGKTAKMLNVQRRVNSSVSNFFQTVDRRSRGLPLSSKNLFLGLLKKPAGAWLEWQYGIRPLLSTIFGLADENIRTVLNRVQGFGGRASDMSYKPTTFRINTVNGTADFPIISSDIKCSVTYGIALDVGSGFDLSRFTSLNPASIAWELMPYSFVVDWFFNVGGYLRSLETALINGAAFRGGYKTRLSAVSGITYGYTKSGKNRFSWEKSFAEIVDGQFRGLDLNRSVLLTYPFPNLPSLRADLGSSRLLSGAALLAQFVKGR